ncbi:non-canonical purine NTP diphosphatase [Mesonia aestuariivivens]|uniref:dITP/XTP pyrophosphatase n=1 Tax=Mesonia aestuariivivens TaxID=2796128 RepID=A0ABS6W3U8_9FLAO|nr:non-canonical purine NTP diphosphatase [Mesonia aestuariivivens]MBW2962520.1 non-canonical purine NTP diphosphatase [Mesonia aestuariivivens]
MRLVFATHNKNKFKEIKSLLPNFIELLSLDDIGCTEDIEETGKTIDENAIIKAKYVKEKYKYNCFADDTGLEVDELGGEPGVYSARYAGEQKDDQANINKLLTQLEGKQNRKARFKTVIALTLNNKETLFTGNCEGEILKDKKGDQGFGYDPIFKPKGYEKTFAEMNLTEKSTISHRAKAFNQLKNYLSE